MPVATASCRTLARLSDGVECVSPPEGMQPGEVGPWLRRNKYPLLALGERVPDWLRADPVFQQQLADESEWYATQHREYEVVQRAWFEHGIQGLMIKSAGNAPSFPYLSDNIDVAVRPQHGPSAREVLRQLGYVELRNIEEPSKYLFRKFHAGRCVSAIHVHEQVIWLVGFMDEDALWSRMRQSADDPLVNVPSPEDAILINLAHACYENKLLRLLEVVRVRHALRTAGDRLDGGYLERVASSRGWRDGLAFMLCVYGVLERALFDDPLLPAALEHHCESLVRDDPHVWARIEKIRSASDVDLPLDLSYWFCKRLYYRKILADPTVSVDQRRRDVVSTLLQGIKLKSRLRFQPGCVISISGPDGSGKTSHAQALSGALRLCELNATYLWNRGGSTGLLRAANAVRRLLGGQRAAGSLPEDSVTRRRRLSSNPLLRFAWSWLVALDQVATYAIRARLPAMVGRIVVADRYAYDTAVEMEASLPADAHWSRLAIAAMLRLVPRPTFAYVLDVDPDTARARKPEEVWHADLAAEREHYRSLAERFAVRTISTAGSFGEGNDRLIRETMMTYMATFETWPNGLFMANPSQRNAPDRAWMNGAAR